MPPVFQPQTIIPPTFAPAQVPVAGALGYKDGALAVGDGVTVQGNLINNTRRFTGSATLDVVGITKAGAPLRVFEIPISAAEAGVGTTIRITGWANYFKSDIGSISELHIGVAWDVGSQQAHDGSVGWSNTDLHPNTGTNTAITFARSTVFGELALTEGNPGKAYLDPSALRAIGDVAIYSDGTDTVITSPVSTPNPHFTEESDDGVATSLWLMVQVAATGGGNFPAASTFFVAYDIFVDVTPV
jgi:hypothetical protein